MPDRLRNVLVRYRICNTKLPVERGRYINIPRDQRHCDICNESKLGDEFHFILECKQLKDIRMKHLPKKYCNNPNTLKLDALFNGSHNLLVKLCKFLVEAGTFVKK